MEGRSYKFEYRPPDNRPWREIEKLLAGQYPYIFVVPAADLYDALKWLHKRTGDYEWTNRTVWIKDSKTAAMFKLTWMI